MKRAIVAGCGFVGKIVARLLVKNGCEVLGLTHSPDSAQALANEPFRAAACDISEPAALAQLNLEKADLVVDCVSSGRGGVEEYRRNYLEGARHLLEAVQPRRFIFTSSTSVYAQTDGSLVDERSPAEPARETGKVLRETEELVLAHGGIVARLAGIYGPGRSVLLQKFLENRAVLEGDGQRWLNQIHRDDAASALVFLANENIPTGIYNVCDDTPFTQLAFYEILANQLGQPLPGRGPVDLNRKRAWTNKRVSNAKLRALGWSPRYPSFRSALADLCTTKP